MSLIVLHLYSCYSGINAGEVARRVSEGECDSFRVPATFPAQLLSDGRQAPQGLDTNITLPHTWFNVLQMAAPRAAIWLHLATGVGCLRGCRASAAH